MRLIPVNSTRWGLLRKHLDLFHAPFSVTSVHKIFSVFCLLERFPKNASVHFSGIFRHDIRNLEKDAVGHPAARLNWVCKVRKKPILIWVHVDSLTFQLLNLSHHILKRAAISQWKLFKWRVPNKVHKFLFPCNFEFLRHAVKSKALQPNWTIGQRTGNSLFKWSENIVW